MQHKGDCTMIGKITEESMRLIADDIVDAVESTDDREMKINRIKLILEDNGIVEVIPDWGCKHPL